MTTTCDISETMVSRKIEEVESLYETMIGPDRTQLNLVLAHARNKRRSVNSRYKLLCKAIRIIKGERI